MRQRGEQVAGQRDIYGRAAKAGGVVQQMAGSGGADGGGHRGSESGPFLFVLLLYMELYEAVYGAIF